MKLVKYGEPKTLMIEIHFSGGHHATYPIKKIQRDELLKLLDQNYFNPFYSWEIEEIVHKINLNHIAYISYEKI